MATLQDIQNTQAAEVTAEGKMISLLQLLSTDLAQLQAQLAVAIANNDPTAMQAVVDSMNTQVTEMNAAIAQFTPTTGTTTTSGTVAPPPATTTTGGAD